MIFLKTVAFDLQLIREISLEFSRKTYHLSTINTEISYFKTTHTSFVSFKTRERSKMAAKGNAPSF